MQRGSPTQCCAKMKFDPEAKAQARSALRTLHCGVRVRECSGEPASGCRGSGEMLPLRRGRAGPCPCGSRAIAEPPHCIESRAVCFAVPAALQHAFQALHEGPAQLRVPHEHTHTVHILPEK